MICCILALLLVGPLGAVLAPIWGTRRAGSAQSRACCAPRYALLRTGTILLGVLLLSATVAAGLNFVDPPVFRHLCTFHVFR